MSYTINTITGEVIKDKDVMKTGPNLVKEPSWIARFFERLKKRFIR